MVSHDLQWVMQGTQRVICLNHHICCTGTPENIQNILNMWRFSDSNVCPINIIMTTVRMGSRRADVWHIPHPHIHPEAGLIHVRLADFAPAWLMGCVLPFLLRL